jgi:coproporphyrinogen III oxidase-like Fe-S oxidoreductase
MNQQYTDALLTELSMIAASTSRKIFLRSVYFGGGTPSLAPLPTLEKILHAIYKSDSSPFQVEVDAEVTIEMDPGTFDLAKLKAVKEIGFNRISLGVQSLDDSILETLGRVHRSSDVYNSIDMIRQVYGEDGSNYSIDLISGVPGLTLAAWTETLYKAIRLHPRPLHISLYDLQVETGTAFWKWYDGGEVKDTTDMAPAGGEQTKTSNHPALPSTEECAWQYKYASGYLRYKGYEHYEISSYAYCDPCNKVSHRSKHNQIYWELGGNWYSIGLGSTSSLDGVRYARPRALSDYISWAQELKQSSKPPWLLPTEEMSGKEFESENLLDIVMTRLRTSDGLDLDWIAGQRQFNEAHIESILRGFQLAIDLDLGTISASGDHSHGIIRLRDPDGFLFSNNIISNIFMELDLACD